MNALAKSGTASLPSEIRLRIFEEIDADHIAHAVTDRGCEPLIRRGEVAVITDQRCLYPEVGGWYLIEHSQGESYFSKRPFYSREIAVAYQDARENWWTRSPTNRQGGVLSCADGPYDLNHLADKIIGQVVGIYRPQQLSSLP